MCRMSHPETKLVTFCLTMRQFLLPASRLRREKNPKSGRFPRFVAVAGPGTTVAAVGSMNAILSFDNRDKVLLSAVVILASAKSHIFFLPNSAMR